MSQPQFWYDSKVNSPGSFTTSWLYLPFNFYSNKQIIISPYNTNTDDLLISWDGQTVAGRISVSSYALNLQAMRRNAIWVKANSATQDALIIAY